MPLLENITAYNQSNFTEMLFQGNAIEAVFGAYYNIIDLWIFFLVFAFTFGMIYVKTQSLAIVSIVMLFITAVATTFMPVEMLYMMFILIGICIAILIASLFLKTI